MVPRIVPRNVCADPTALSKRINKSAWTRDEQSDVSDDLDEAMALEPMLLRCCTCGSFVEERGKFCRRSGGPMVRVSTRWDYSLEVLTVNLNCFYMWPPARCC